MTLNKNASYYSREELAGAIIEIQDKLDILLSSSDKKDSVDNTYVIEGMSQEINYLKDELNKAWDRIVALENKTVSNISEPKVS